MEETKQDERPVEELTFREGMAELERTVAALEGNTLELEESLARYERGVALIRSLRSRLDGAQQRVEVLMGELDAAQDDEAHDATLS